MTEAMTSPLPAMPDGIEQVVHTVSTSDSHEVTVYHFRRRGEPRQDGAPAIVHVHGGGHIALSAEQCVFPHNALVSRTGVQMLSIDYRLAPEHPYPTPLDDCWVALKWVYANAQRLSIDAARIAVMGEGAGGGLAAALALRSRDYALSPPLSKQILVYPTLDDRTTTNRAGGLAFWTDIDDIPGWTWCLEPDAGTNRVEAYAAPARLEKVEGLPPLYLDCLQLDIFVHECLEHVGSFVAANIPTECDIHPGLPHEFEALAPSASVTQQAIINRDKATTSF